VPDKKLKIAVLGDSTVTQQNWGTLISDYYAGSLTFENYAKSGESSKSFIMNGYWDQALKSDAHIFLIQFGHNDCPNKGNRTTDPQTSYKFYLQKYIDDIKALGSKTILVTPMERRNFNSKGKIKLGLDKYAQAMKEVGQANNIPVIDLHSQSVALYERLGKEKSDALGPKGDRTHFNQAGAEQITKIVVELLDDIKFLSSQRRK